MMEQERAAQIRKGNQLFNEGKVLQAAELYKKTEYKDGLIRIGDYFYFTKHQPLMAYGYYRRANHKMMLDKISSGFVFALKCWLSEDKPGEEKKDNPQKNQTSLHEGKSKPSI